MNTVAYVRVSTDEQTTDNQTRDLQQLATSRGWDLEIRAESGSAAKARPVLDRLMRDCQQGRVSRVLIWRLDRLDRSMSSGIARVLELDRLGVQLISYNESWLDTSSPARSLLVSIFAWLAEEERRVLIERTQAGIRRAKAQGKRLGRPPVSPVLLHAAADRVRAGESLRKAAKASGVPKSSLARFLVSQS